MIKKYKELPCGNSLYFFMDMQIRDEHLHTLGNDAFTPKSQRTIQYSNCYRPNAISTIFRCTLKKYVFAGGY